MVLLLGSYFIFPRVTEFFQFGSVFAGRVAYAPDNFVFQGMRQEYSLQVISSYLFSLLGLSPITVEVIGGLFSTMLAVSCVFMTVKTIIPNRNYRLLGITFLQITLIFFILEFKIDVLYPIRFPLSYAIFGNSGYWFAALVLALVANKKTLGSFLLGILVGWHPVWGVLVIGAVLHRKSLERYPGRWFSRIDSAFTLFLLGGLISLAGFGLHAYVNYNNLSSNSIDAESFISTSAQAQREVDTTLTHHNLRLDSINGFPQLAAILGFYFLFVLLGRKNFTPAHRNLTDLISSMLVVGLILSFVVAMIPYVQFPFSDILARGIPSRVFNLPVIFNTVTAIGLIAGFRGRDDRSRPALLVAILWLCIAHTFTGLLVASLLIVGGKVQLWSRLKIRSAWHGQLQAMLKRPISLMLTLVLVLKASILNAHFFTVYDYFVMVNPLLKELRGLDVKESRILLGPNIPPHRGLNLSLATSVEWLQFGHRYGNIQRRVADISGCDRRDGDDMTELILKDWGCIEKLTPEQWTDVKLSTGITHVIVVEPRGGGPLSVPILVRSGDIAMYKL